MSTAVVIAIVAVVALAILFVATTARRRDRALAMRGMREAGSKDRSLDAMDDMEGEAVSGREVERAAVLAHRGGTAVAVPATPAPPAPRAPLDDEALGVTRRQFFNRGIVAMFGLSLGGFGASTLGFLWPSLSGGFGSKIRVGKLDEILGQIASTREPFYVAEARTYIVPYPKDALDKARGAYTGAVLEGMEQGVAALYQKCVHLGCRVPWCASSQWFECPCHGSKYNRVGEKKGGPAPRGLDRFGVSVDGGQIVVDTAQVIQGPKIGVNTTGQEAEGPQCA
jgi:cytochrome b6-f complex iron-sulfur subunit